MLCLLRNFSRVSISLGGAIAIAVVALGAIALGGHFHRDIPVTPNSFAAVGEKAPMTDVEEISGQSGNTYDGPAIYDDTDDDDPSSSAPIPHEVRSLGRVSRKSVELILGS